MGTDPDPRAALPIDWAEFVTLALAGAAANVGSTAKILSGRPGSWEADRLRETPASTVGADDEDLCGTVPTRSPASCGSTTSCSTSTPMRSTS